MFVVLRNHISPSHAQMIRRELQPFSFCVHVVLSSVRLALTSTTSFLTRTPGTWHWRTTWARLQTVTCRWRSASDVASSCHCADHSTLAPWARREKADAICRPRHSTRVRRQQQLAHFTITFSALSKIACAHRQHTRHALHQSHTTTVATTTTTTITIYNSITSRRRRKKKRKRTRARIY